jgi:putative hemolysin
MLFSLLLLSLFVLLSAFFSSSETAFLSANRTTLESLEAKGSKPARRVRRILSRINDFLTTILIGNTLVNAAAASLATYLAGTLIADRERAVLAATFGTTLIILVFSEINPKIYAAHHPLKLAFWLSRPIRACMIVLYPFVKAFGFLIGLVFPSGRKGNGAAPAAISVEETKILLNRGVAGVSAFGRNMITEILDIAARPVKEIMTPRPEVKAVEIGMTREQVLEIVRGEGFSRYPVYRGRLDHVEGIIHTKDLLAVLIEGRDFDLSVLLRKPFFIPESAPVEKALLQMQENAVHLAFAVDEFGNVEGIVTLEDILEEIVGEIRDESDAAAEAIVVPAGPNVWLVKGSARIKDVNKALAFDFPESAEYSTLAGFFLSEFGRIPREGDALDRGGRRLTVERMAKRHIGLIRVEIAGA